MFRRLFQVSVISGVKPAALEAHLAYWIWFAYGLRAIEQWNYEIECRSSYGCLSLCCFV